MGGFYEFRNTRITSMKSSIHKNLLRRQWLMAFVAIAIFATPVSTARAEDAKVVRLTVDYGDGVQKVFYALPWKEKTTAFAVLQAAEKHARGIKVEHQGSGSTTLVTAIDGAENQGRGSNWIFEVNGKLGEKSCALVELKPGDAVLWRFGDYR